MQPKESREESGSAVSRGPRGLSFRLTSSGRSRRDFLSEGYGPANFDRAQRFVLSSVYSFPAVRGHHVLEKLLGGWLASSVITVQSGLPFSITDSLGASLYGLNGSRASFAPGATIDSALGSGPIESRLAYGKPVKRH